MGLEKMEDRPVCESNKLADDRANSKPVFVKRHRTRLATWTGAVLGGWKRLLFKPVHRLSRSRSSVTHMQNVKAHGMLSRAQALSTGAQDYL